MREDLVPRARCVREVLGLGARSVRQVTLKKKTHSYKKSTEHLLNSFEMLDHSQFIIDLAILKSTNYSNAR